MSIGKLFIYSYPSLEWNHQSWKLECWVPFSYNWWCHNSSLKKKKTCRILPVLFYPNIFSLFSFLSPNFSLWKSRSDNSNNNYRLGPNCQKPGWERPHLLPVLYCALVFFGRNASHFLRNHTAGSTAVFLEPKVEGFCSPYGRLMFSLRKASISSSKRRCLARPFLFQQLIHIPLQPSQDKGGCCVEQLHEPLRELELPLREQSFGLDYGLDCVTLFPVDETRRCSLQRVIQSQSPKVEGKLPFSFQFTTQGSVCLNPS